jgi:hypothetical protein
MELHSWLSLMTSLEACTQLMRLHIRTIMDAGCYTTGEDEFIESLCRILGRNKALEHLNIYFMGIGCKNVQPLVNALADHPTLAVASIRLYSFGVREAMELATRNRKIERLYIAPMRTTISSSRTEMQRVVANNWSLHTFQCIDIIIRTTTDKTWSAAQGIRRAVLNFGITLLPLQLPVYELLWVLDWLSPMSIRYVWRGDPAYDPHHVKKVRLIEGLTRSYQALKK